ncbi:hypothetical protein LINPERHAP2_LOCUS24677 [Linum perenne]
MQEDSEVNPRCPKVTFLEAELRTFFRPWSKALVVKVLEKNFSFGAVKRRLESLWAKNGNIQVSDIANSFFLVRFEHPDDYQRAAFRGPWKIYDYYISVGLWTPDFNEEEPLKTILTWVRLPKLPIHFFNQLAVTRIGNCIGKTVRLDLATSEGARAKYARVCVEVDLSKPLLGKYMIDNRTFLVEYESLQNICTSCGFYGHKADGCKPTLVPNSDGAQFEESSTNVEPIEEAVGDWMVVNRRAKGRSQKASQTKQGMASTSSRFAVPAESDEEVDEEILADEIPTPSPDRLADNESVVLAANLAAALSQASHENDGATFVTPASAKARRARKPLVDVTNANITSKEKLTAPKATKPLTPPSEIVNVPVVYDNPTFIGSKVVVKNDKGKKQVARREKSTTTKDRSSSLVKPIGKDGKQIRSFMPRKGVPKPRSPTVAGVEKAGEPPDRS